MVIAHELGMSVRRFFQEIDQEELGWWMAYFQVKNKKEEKERERVKRRRNSRSGKFPVVD